LIYLLGRKESKSTGKEKDWRKKDRNEREEKEKKEKEGKERRRIDRLQRRT